MWYISLAGQQIPLGITDPAAVDEAQKAAQDRQAGPTVAEGVAHYLAQIEDRVRPITLAGYRAHLQNFTPLLGDSIAASIATTTR